MNSQGFTPISNRFATSNGMENANWTVSRCKTVLLYYCIWPRNILITIGKKIDVKTFGVFCAFYGASYVTLIKGDGNSELIKNFMRVYFATVCTLTICSFLLKPPSPNEHAQSMLRDMSDTGDLLSGASILLQIVGIYWAFFSPMDTPYCCCFVSICVFLVLCAAAYYYRRTSRVTVLYVMQQKEQPKANSQCHTCQDFSQMPHRPTPNLESPSQHVIVNGITSSGSRVTALKVMQQKEQPLITYQRRKVKQTGVREANSQCHTGHSYHELSPIPHRRQHVIANGITSSGSRVTALDVMQQKEQPLITYQRRKAKQTGVVRGMDNVSNRQ